MSQQKYESFDEFLKYEHKLLEKNMTYSINMDTEESFEEMEDPLSVARINIIKKVNKNFLTIDSQEIIQFPPLSHKNDPDKFNVIHKMYANFMSDHKRFELLVQKVKYINNCFSNPVLLLKAFGFNPSKTTCIPENFWSGNRKHLILTLAWSELTRNMQSSAGLDNNFNTRYINFIDNNFVQKLFTKDAQSDILYVELSNIFISPQIDLWKFLLLVLDEKKWQKSVSKNFSDITSSIEPDAFEKYIKKPNVSIGAMIYKSEMDPNLTPKDANFFSHWSYHKLK